jgi:aminoglycoside 2'-N-acetyltransferase I
MTEVRTAHTADLDRTTLDAAHSLLKSVFGDELSAADWNHALGGVHALVWERGALLAHGSVVQRRLIHGGRTLRAGYVEGVAVRTDRRGRGHGVAVMAALERVVRGAHDLGALSATDEGAPLYAARGWKRWGGKTSALTPGGIVRTAEHDDSVYVYPVTVPLETSAELICDWREGDLW